MPFNEDPLAPTDIAIIVGWAWGVPLPSGDAATSGDRSSTDGGGSGP